MGFETGDKPVKTIIQTTPDFKKSLDDYHHRVNEMGVQIKTYSDELASVQAQLAQAKADLQAHSAIRCADHRQEPIPIISQLEEIDYIVYISSITGCDQQSCTSHTCKNH